MEFDNTSQATWDEMQAGTPFAGPKKDEGKYTADFYGPTREEFVDYDKLEAFIVFGKTTQHRRFNYRDYAVGIDEYLNNDFNHPHFVLKQLEGNGGFSYVDSNGKERVASVFIRLNKRIDDISPKYSHGITIDGNTNTINASFLVHYEGTESKRDPNTETESKTDFFIENKYVAISISTYSLEAYFVLYNYLEGKADSVKKEAVKLFVSELKKAKSSKSIAFLYSNIPASIQQTIATLLGEELMLRHLYALKGADDANWFSDESGPILKILQMMTNGNPEFLYNLCARHPRVAKELYYNMHGDSFINGAKYPNRFIFANLMLVLGLLNGFKGMEKTGHVYRIGKGYTPDSNVDETNDRFREGIFLKQYKERVRDISWYERFYRVPLNGKVTDDVAVTNGHYYFPMSPLKLIDLNTEDQTPSLVPAIFIKYLADTEEWKEIMFYVRIGLNLLAVILGILSLGTTSGLIFVLAVADIGLSSADILVVLNDDLFKNSPEGRAFLETWDKIMLVGGIVTAGPLLLETVFTSGTKLLSKAALEGAKAETKNFIRASLMKIILEKNIIFSKGSLIILDTGTEIFMQSRKIFRILQATELQKAGVVFAKLQQTIDGKVLENGFAVFYKGELLVMGEAKKVREALKEVWGLKGAKLTAKLDELWEQIPKLDESGNHWIARNKAGVYLKWANQKGNITHSIESALKKTNNAAILWEGKVAKEVSNYEEVINFRNKISTSKLDSPGELDIESKQFIFECKSSLSVGVLNSGRLERQLIKFVDSAGEEYINLHAKKVVLVIESFGDGVSINHPILTRIAKKHGITIIEGISGIKKLY